MDSWLRQHWQLVAVGLVVLAVLLGVGAGRSWGRPEQATPAKTPQQAKHTASKTNPSPKANGVDCAKAKCIALSFDDGPGDYTAKMLDILEAQKVKATFFVWGGKYNGKALLQREAKDGMEIGNHTWHHKDLTTLTPAEVKWEITTTADSIEQAIGKRPTLMRPPYGAHNAEVDKITGELGEAVIMWDIDPEDWKYADPAELARFMAKNAKPGGIVDMHERQATLDALPKLISELRQRGYTFVTISQLLGDNLKPGQVYGLDKPN